MKPRNRVKFPQSVFMRRTRELLVATNTPYIEICKITNISPHWLSLFANDQIPDPSVNRVEVLYNYLNGAPLVIG